MTTLIENPYLRQQERTNKAFHYNANQLIKYGGFTEFWRPPLFVDSNGTTRQIIYFAMAEDGKTPLVGCNTVIIGSEMNHIMEQVAGQIGNHWILFNTYDGLYLGKIDEYEKKVEKIPQ